MTLHQVNATGGSRRARLGSRPPARAWLPGPRRPRPAGRRRGCASALARSLDTRSGVYRATVSRTYRVSQNDSPNPKPIPMASQNSRLNTPRPYSWRRRRRNRRAARPVPDANASVLITGFENARYASRDAESRVVEIDSAVPSSVSTRSRSAGGLTDGAAHLHHDRERLAPHLLDGLAQHRQCPGQLHDRVDEHQHGHAAGDRHDDRGGVTGVHRRPFPCGLRCGPGCEGEPCARRSPVRSRGLRACSRCALQPPGGGTPARPSPGGRREDSGNRLRGRAWPRCGSRCRGGAAGPRRPRRR